MPDKPPTEWWERMARNEEGLSHLEEWQKRQNGTLDRIDGRIDKIYLCLLGIGGGVITSLVMIIINLFK